MTVLTQEERWRQRDGAALEHLPAGWTLSHIIVGGEAGKPRMRAWFVLDFDGNEQGRGASPADAIRAALPPEDPS